MTQKHVLITGGSRNIGLEISQNLQNQDYKVINLDIIAPQKEGIGDFFQVDLSDTTKLQNILEQIVKKYNITSFVHCAGILKTGALGEISIEDFYQTVNVNIWPYIQIAQILLPYMKKEKFGRIIAIASRSVLGIREESVYAASKSALISLTKCWALELAQFGITCNAVAPGPVDTIMTKMVYPENSLERENYISNIPLGRFGTEQDVAFAVNCFMNPDSSFITGQILYSCGGLTIGKAKL